MRPHDRLLRPFGPLAIAAACAACGERYVTSPVALAPDVARTVAVATVVVGPGTDAGWTMQAHGASRALFAGPVSRDGEGRGSLAVVRGARFQVGTGHADGALVRTEQFAGTPLSDLTALGFSTYVSQRGRADATPFLILAIDLDGDGYVDDHLMYRPAPALGVWQAWDALAGEWWSNSGIGSPDARGYRTLAGYRAAAPKARLASALTIGAWDVGGSAPLEAQVDQLVVGIGGRTTMFRFGLPTSAAK